MSNDNKVVKSGIWYTISNFLSKGILFLATPIFTRLLTKAEFGTFSTFSSWLNIFMIVITLNVEASLISARFDFEKKLDKYVFSSLALSTTSTLIFAIVCNVFMGPVSSFLEIKPLYINCIFAYLLFFPALQLFQTQERYFFRYKTSTALSLASSIGSCLLSVALVYTVSNKLSGRIFGHILPTVIIGLFLYILIAVRGRSIDFRFWKYTLKVCLPYIPHLLSMTILKETDRIMITKFCGEEETALYSVAYSVAMIVTLLMNALNGAFSPWLAEKLSKEEYSTIRKSSKLYIGLFVIFAVGLLLLAPEVLYIMGGEAYMEAKPIMIPVAVGCMCQFLYTLFVNVEQFYKKTVGMAIASVSAAVLNYLLNLWLIPRFGYIAAAYTTLAGYLWLLVIHMLLVRKIKKQHVYSYKFVLLVLAGMGLLAVCAALLYTNNIIRYTFILVYMVLLIVVAWKNKSKLIGFIKK
ncbi:MAG: hypothetical protein E7388_04920 [Ruminococcaceae bacterium]|nr:hypothetical protein [Oscillospiraceae bacterium]